MIGIYPPMRHRATLERNTEDGLSPTRQPLPPSYEEVTVDLPCFYWEPGRSVDGARAGLREGPDVVAVALGPQMLVGRRADVRVGDRVTGVRFAQSGEVITDQASRIVEVLFRQTHTHVGLELISSGPLVEGEGS